jgi:hypothetical protein
MLDLILLPLRVVFALLVVVVAGVLLRVLR